VRGTVLYGPRDVRFEERTAPTIMKPTDAIIRITATYVCGSHLWPLQGHQPRRGAHFSSLPYGWRSAT
jgi:threonine dehydrogenase-like Zn-dependent dehydrogenase